MFGQFPIQIITNHARFHTSVPIFNAYLENPVHFGKINDHSSLDRDHPSAEAGPCPSGNDRDLMFVSKLDNSYDLFCCFRPDGGVRPMDIHGGVVTVGYQLFQLVCEIVLSHNFDQFFYHKVGPSVREVAFLTSAST